MASGSTTVGALPYPVSTDAPSVHTDIQALAQALANRLMSPSAHAVSATLSDGELAVSTASPITLTLPSAAANAKVGVFAKVATAANPVTVSSGSSNIYGLGLNGVSSLVLGTIGAFVVLQSDGTNWFVVAGQQDTGWVALALATNIASGGYGASSRLRGDTVRLKGTLTNGTGSTDTATLATITAAHRPSVTVNLTAAASGAAPTVNVQITTGGALADPNGLVAGAILSLDGLTYTLS